MGVEYRLLGPLEALVDGRPVDLGAPRHRATLVLLLAQANAVVPAQRLIDELWHDDPPASATNVVQGAVSHLRKLVGRDAIVTRGTGYAVRVGPTRSTCLDSSVSRRRAASRSSARTSTKRRPRSSAALDLWAGPALADLTDEPSVQPVAARLEELRLLASERRLEAELGRGRHDDLLSDSQGAGARASAARARPRAPDHRPVSLGPAGRGARGPPLRSDVLGRGAGPRARAQPAGAGAPDSPSRPGAAGSIPQQRGPRLGGGAIDRVDPRGAPRSGCARRADRPGRAAGAQSRARADHGLHRFARRPARRSQPRARRAAGGPAGPRRDSAIAPRSRP